MFVYVEFSISLFLQCCAYAPITYRQKNPLGLEKNMVRIEIPVTTITTKTAGNISLGVPLKKSSGVTWTAVWQPC